MPGDNPQQSGPIMSLLASCEVSASKASDALAALGAKLTPILIPVPPPKGGPPASDAGPEMQVRLDRLNRKLAAIQEAAADLSNRCRL